ncbi:carbonic anhydrase [Mariprofundus ferrinatatus]|uniref:Carbonic anhydrase n=1 Tax=Mariprofundus ferrinatatus TaxID=1921087 RepID=A0A2K8L0U3_9PROT|nr:carbonate dehydratase [Mariprofundus ferrinatatus]ATX80897.1 carbonic anhydrase [Mariprofundus ferrinatatus]
MCSPEKLLENNKAWAAQTLKEDPGFFDRLAGFQNPRFFWIGCSDSRVPANEITGLQPGQVFVHRNVANQVHHTDLNCLSAAQYAVDVLGVKHIVITGHYGCGGVRAAMAGQHHGIVDNWIRSIRDTYMLFEKDLEQLPEQERMDRLCELNVARQVDNICHTRIVQNAWERGDELSVHGWIYRLKDGILRDLKVTKRSPKDVAPLYRVTGMEYSSWPVSS